MSLVHSPSIVTDGLVLYYDMSNTKKSWKGAPTVNLLANPANEVIGTSSEFLQYADLAPIFDTYGVGTYSLSLDLRSKVAGTMLVYMQNGSSTKYSFVNQNVTASTEYQRFTFNGLTAAISTGTDTMAKLAFYGVYGSGRIPSIKNVQVEQNAFATPFVNGARSNTQTLVDLTNINTLTTNSLTYNSDNTFSFNATANYITMPNNTAFNTQTPTIEVWVKASTLSQNGFLFEKGALNTQYALFLQGSSIVWRITLDGIMTDIYATTATYINTSSYAQIVATYVSGTRCIYINGKLVAASASSGVVATNAGGGYIGAYNSVTPAYYFSGNIASVKVYNRNLSAIEVSNNFNATRSRFGI